MSSRACARPKLHSTWAVPRSGSGCPPDCESQRSSPFRDMAVGFTHYATRFVKLVEGGSARQHDLFNALSSSVPPAGRTEEARAVAYAIAAAASTSFPA